MSFVLFLLPCPLTYFAIPDKDLTNSEVADFFLVGQSRAIANLSIGQITLDPIKVNVSTTLNGLQGLKGKTTIDSVDVTGGSTDGINLAIQGKFGFHT